MKSKRLIILSGLFVTLLVCSNIMAVKTISVLGFTLPAAVIMYPFCFALGDIINEFYGFKTIRGIIILTFVCNAVAVIFLNLAAIMPPSQYFEYNQAFMGIFMATPLILLASFAAFLVGNILDSYIFSRFRAKGSKLSTRALASSLVGIVVDSMIFITIVYAFTVPPIELLLMIAAQSVAKLIFGVALGVPATMLIIHKMKKQEQTKETVEE